MIMLIGPPGYPALYRNDRPDIRARVRAGRHICTEDLDPADHATDTITVLCSDSSGPATAVGDH